MHADVFRSGYGWRKLVGVVVVAGGMLLGLSSQSMAYTIAVTPGSQTANVGSQVSVSIFASDLVPYALGSYNLDLSFEAGVLGFSSITDGFGMGDAFGITWGLSGNVLTVTDTSLDDPLTLISGQSPSFNLFTVTFDALAEGTSFLSLSGVVLSDAWGESGMAIETLDGSVTVSQVTTPVPEPDIWVLMLLGTLAVAWTKRRDAAGRTRMRGLDSLALKG